MVAMEKQLPIVLICDKNFIMPTAVAITSLIRNKDAATFLDIHILCSDCAPEDVRVLETLAKNEDRVTVSIRHVSAKQYGDIIRQISTISVSAVLKFDICELFPKYDRILYIDGDLIVRGDLWSLYHDTDFSDELFAAVLHSTCIVDDGRRINSGVILFNAKKMREEGMRDKLVSYRAGRGDQASMDQQTFNVVCRDRILYLPPRYNCIPRLLLNELRPPVYTMEEFNRFFHTEYRTLEEIFNDACIFHFSAEKPWVYHDLPLADEWMHYYKLSPYGAQPLSRGGRLKRLSVLYQKGGLSAAFEYVIKGPLRRKYYAMRSMEFRRERFEKDWFG